MLLCYLPNTPASPLSQIHSTHLFLSATVLFIHHACHITILYSSVHCLPFSSFLSALFSSLLTSFYHCFFSLLVTSRTLITSIILLFPFSVNNRTQSFILAHCLTHSGHWLMSLSSCALSRCTLPQEQWSCSRPVPHPTITPSSLPPPTSTVATRMPPPMSFVTTKPLKVSGILL